MKLSAQESHILFCIGRCHEQINNHFSGKPVTLDLSKLAFIEIAKKAELVHKGERALYKNLENLEEKKLVEYRNKSLRLTERGTRYYSQLWKKTEPYINLHSKISAETLLKQTTKAKTVLSRG